MLKKIYREDFFLLPDQEFWTFYILLRKGKDYFYKYSDSPEYSDFELLLEIAKELGLDVRVINFPINGKWNDYIGVDAEQRKIYREKLTNIVQSYGYSIFDLGDKEYEPYYMFDTVHPGWKAWIEAYFQNNDCEVISMQL